MDKMRDIFFKSLTSLFAFAALFDVGTTSMFLYHQPDLPQELRKK
jgi:cyclic lactone autoinducer peptide